MIKRSSKRAAAKTAGRIKSVTTFLSDAAEGFEGTNLLEAIGEALPWAELVAGAAAESLAPIKFIVKLIEKATSVDDPSELALMACTLAYQRAIQEAISDAGPPAIPRLPSREEKEALRKLDDSAPSIRRFDAFSVPAAGSHPFLLHAEAVLAGYLRPLGYDDAAGTKIILAARGLFSKNLIDLLSNRKTLERFQPLVTRMSLESTRARLHAVEEHLALQQWQYFEKPALGRERFALADIYVEPQADLYRWGDLKENRLAAPNKSGSLGEMVLDLIAHSKRDEPIVIEGPAGAGKSAFTSWLAVRLAAANLKPIRIQLRDVPFESANIIDALGRAIRLADEGFRGGRARLVEENVFGAGELFREQWRYRKSVISSYVLILDGWDEVSISSSQGFRKRIDDLMAGIRTSLLHAREAPVRVCLTGRPSEEIRSTPILHSETPLLRIRQLEPAALEQLASTFARFSVQPPKPASPELLDWPPVDTTRFAPVLEHYRNMHARQAGRSHLDVLGLPLLAHLALRMLSEPNVDAHAILRDPTTLYRQLIDLTAKKAGKYAEEEEGIDDQHRVAGMQLRELIQHTAVAMTTLGEESISRIELQKRLNVSESALHAQTVVVDDNTFSRLIVSYYFKPENPDLGCEFLHKSFREYLFAEHIVEVLKNFARDAGRMPSERPAYWRDFDESDPRRALAHELTKLLGPQWLTRDVAAHVSRLLEWEIGRATTGSARSAGYQTGNPISLPEWAVARDALAGVWDWWGEGVLLRAQPNGGVLATDVAKWSRRFEKTDRRTIDPIRTTTIDSHVGDGLFLLCASVHFYLARRTGWLQDYQEHPRPAAMWHKPTTIGYQTWTGGQAERWVLFAPGGQESKYWTNYVARINAAGFRPAGTFPNGSELRGTDLRNAAIFIDTAAAEDETKLDYANISSARLSRSDLVKCSFVLTLAYEAKFEGAYIENTTFDEADLTRARFDRSQLSRVTFSGGTLFSTSFVDTQIRASHFDCHRLATTQFAGADLDHETIRTAMRGE